MVAGLSPQAKRWLAGIYRALAAGPLPGQSELDVQPHPRLPNTYTVPFLGGHLVYAVFEGEETGLVGILHHESRAGGAAPADHMSDHEPLGTGTDGPDE